jgi:hypothetical protein
MIDTDDRKWRRYTAQQPPQLDVIAGIDAKPRGAGGDIPHRHGVRHSPRVPEQKSAAFERRQPARLGDERS